MSGVFSCQISTALLTPSPPLSQYGGTGFMVHAPLPPGWEGGKTGSVVMCEPASLLAQVLCMQC
jgi:hypothetical protein